jgi:hypothetical protein
MQNATIYIKTNMKLVLTERQLKQLKLFLVKKSQLNEEKIRKGVELKSVEAIGSKKQEQKPETTKREPILDRSKIKINSIKELEKVLQVLAHQNKGLKIPTKIKSKFEKEVKFGSDIIRDLKTKIVKLIKTTTGVKETMDEKKDVFMSTKNKTDKTGKLKSSNLKSEMRKALKVKSIEFPLTDVEIENKIVNDFLMDVSQNYTSNFALQRAEGGRVDLTYGK